MLINIEPTREVVTKIDGQAHIIISLDDKGEARLQAFLMGRLDCTYCKLDDMRLFARELPKLTTELRLQLQSASSGSTVTE